MSPLQLSPNFPGHTASAPQAVRRNLTNIFPAYPNWLEPADWLITREKEYRGEYRAVMDLCARSGT